MDVKLTAAGKAAIEKILGNSLPDAVISVWNGTTWLYDTQIEISNDIIEEIVDGDK